MNDDRPIRILFVEDVPSDIELAVRVIRQEGVEFEWRLVETEDGFAAALDTFRPDIVVSDYSLPMFDGLRALRITRQRDRLLPFVVLTGSVNEETAVECMKAGASDYVLKERMARLPFAIREALAQHRAVEEREAAEQELREREEQYRLLAENMTDTVWLYDVARHRFTFVSPSVERLLGFTVEEMVGKSLPDVLPPEFRLEAQGVLRTRLDAFAAGDISVATQSIEVPQVRKDGTIVHTEIVSSLLVDADGRVTQIQGVTRDITERKRSEDTALWLSRIIDHALSEIYVFDAETLRFVQVNQGAQRNLGYTMQELTRMTPVDLKPAFTRQTFEELIAPLLSRVEEQLIFQTEHRRKDGSLYPVEVRLQLAERETRPTFLAVIQDISERKAVEEALRASQEQLQQAQKMESIGRLAGGIAHDFNNILMVQKGYCELLREGLRSQDPVAEGLSLIEQCADRAAQLTHQLLAFSRRQTLNPVVLDVNALVENLSGMLGRLLGEDVQLLCAPASEPALVLADAGQLEQVVVNLAVNARDAMPSGGRLTIAVSTVESVPPDGGRHPGVSPGSYVVLTVTDTGHGMAADIVPWVFEPFFTTKGEDGGTGLGLSMVYGIVRQSDGHIVLESEPDKGATFKIYLPRVNAKEAQPTEQKAQLARGQGELVLIVEDEAALRRLAALMVQRLGYRAVQAPDAGAALLLVEEEGLRPDVVLTDAVMPGMNAVALVERLLRTIPNLKVVCMSGYATDVLGRSGFKTPDVGFLAKPFAMADLAAALGAALADRAGKG